MASCQAACFSAPGQEKQGNALPGLPTHPPFLVMAPLPSGPPPQVSMASATSPSHTRPCKHRAAAKRACRSRSSGASLAAMKGYVAGGVEQVIGM